MTVQVLLQGPAHEVRRITSILETVFDLDAAAVVIDGNDPDHPPADPTATPQVGPGRATATFEIANQRGVLRLEGLWAAQIAAGQPVPTAQEQQDQTARPHL